MKKNKFTAEIIFVFLLCLITFMVAFFHFLPLAQSQRAQREKHVKEVRRLELAEKDTIKKWETENNITFVASMSSLPLYATLQAERNLIIGKIIVENDLKDKWNQKLSQTSKFGSFSTLTLVVLVLLLSLLVRNKELKED